VLKGLGSQRLVALFVGGWVLFNFPLLGLWDRDATVWGIPLFPAALFLLWGGLIAALAWLMEQPDNRLGDRSDERPDDRPDDRVAAVPLPSASLQD